MASLARPGAAPFLQFCDSAPSWTVQRENHAESCPLSSGLYSPNCSLDNNDPSESEDSTQSLDHFFHNELIQPSISGPLPHYKAQETDIISDFKGKKIHLFVDYDGTLTPIVADPCRAVLSNRMRELLLSLAGSERVTVGIVTGRALTSVKRFVQISATEQLNFLYAASHGFHIEAAGQQLHHRVGVRYIPILREAALKISEELGHIPGVTLEDNEFAVSVHYRYND